MRTTDEGGNWEETGQYGGVLTTVSVQNAQGDYEVFIGSAGNGVFRSTDNGANWWWLQAGVEMAFVDALAVSASGSSGNVIITAVQSIDFDRSIGVFASTNNGVTWRDIGQGLPDEYASVFCITDGYIYAGTYGAGVWRRALSDIVSSTDRKAGEFPGAFILEQNYPNPVPGSTDITAIRFHVSETGRTTLAIYDLLGRLQSVALDEWMNPGTYSVSVNTRNLHAGAYEYRLQTGSFVASRMMVLAQ